MRYTVDIFEAALTQPSVTVITDREGDEQVASHYPVAALEALLIVPSRGGSVITKADVLIIDAHAALRSSWHAVTLRFLDNDCIDRGADDSSPMPRGMTPDARRG